MTSSSSSSSTLSTCVNTPIPPSTRVSSAVLADHNGFSLFPPSSFGVTPSAVVASSTQNQTNNNTYHGSNTHHNNNTNVHRLLQQPAPSSSPFPVVLTTTPGAPLRDQHRRTQTVLRSVAAAIDDATTIHSLAVALKEGYTRLFDLDALLRAAPAESGLVGESGACSELCQILLRKSSILVLPSSSTSSSSSIPSTTRRSRSRSLEEAWLVAVPHYARFVSMVCRFDSTRRTGLDAMVPVATAIADSPMLAQFAVTLCKKLLVLHCTPFSSSASLDCGDSDVGEAAHRTHSALRIVVRALNDLSPVLSCCSSCSVSLCRVLKSLPFSATVAHHDNISTNLMLLSNTARMGNDIDAWSNSSSSSSSSSLSSSSSSSSVSSALSLPKELMQEIELFVSSKTTASTTALTNSDGSDNSNNNTNTAFVIDGA